MYRVRIRGNKAGGNRTPLQKSPKLILGYLIDNADDRSIDRGVLAAGGHSGRAALNDQYLFSYYRMNCVDSDDVALVVVAIGIHGTADQQFLAFESRILSRRDHGPDDARQYHRELLPIGRTSSRFECGRGMTWTLINSPTRRAAAAPASVAAFTAATSPRTMAVT